jgi:hypothetical protein
MSTVRLGLGSGVSNVLNWSVVGDGRTATRAPRKRELSLHSIQEPRLRIA